MRCFFEAMRVRWSPTADVARPPRVCAFARLRGSLREVRIWCYHPVRWSVVLQRYFGDGSRTAVAFWCGAVFFSRFSVEREVIVGVRRLRLFKSVCWWTSRALLLSFRMAVFFFFFLYVVFHDYLLVFIPSLSMKWAPSCAGSLKKKV